jgi:hypothetical protein
MTTRQHKAQHTPGPWHIGMRPGPIVYGPKGEQVADMIPCMLFREEHIANTRLIAAAPELLAALRDVVEAIDAMHTDTTAQCGAHNWLCKAVNYDQAKRAIAKATGGE